MAIASLALFVGTSLLSANQKQAAGEIAKGEAQTQAKATELEVTAREADRKGRLAEALASQNARAGAANIAAFEGSPLSILQADIEREEQATRRDVFSSELQALTTRASGSLAQRQAKTGATIGLLQRGSQLASMAGQ